ncbi:CC0125/CC1285 family lipoprotein [Salinimonas lutimaris]|uniref:CC0125/CC1285 family lipoprotein n=1 Tax=Salinimonas lutimaris TaxID=914153 RepID=UPI0010C0AD16|nr:hypothetical protein [Salinimonas lutimaris]
MAHWTHRPLGKSLCIGLVAASVSLSACVSQSPTQPTLYRAAQTSDAYGYSSMELSDSEYRVMFKATEATPADKVQEYSLYRAAEIARQKGYEWVSLVKTDVQRKSREARSVTRKDTNTLPPVLKEEQCTMSGCNEVAQPYEATDSGVTVEKTRTKDVYYSIVVRMGDSKISTDKRAFKVTDLLKTPPDSKS